jgi:hypothetical protein
MEIKNIENVITIHFDSVVNCIKILNDGNLILTLKKLLKIYSKIFYEEIMNIQIFEGNIFYVTQLKNNNIVACDNNKSIKIIKLYKIWNGKNFFLFKGKIYVGSEYYLGLLTNLLITLYITIYIIFVANVRKKNIILIKKI